MVATSSNNLIGDGTGSVGLANGVNNNLVGSGASPIDPLLGPLADNTGPTRTHALLAGSVAINAGNNATCAATDQRGIARPISGVCDIGSFEFAGPATSTTTLTSNLNPSVFGEAITFTATVTGTGSGTTPTGTVQFLIDGAPNATVPLSGSGQASLTITTLSAGKPRRDRNLRWLSGLPDEQRYPHPERQQGGNDRHAHGQPQHLGLRAAGDLHGDGHTDRRRRHLLRIGHVQDGATVLATTTLAAGTATVTTTALGPGSHSITATYAGDANCNGSTTAALVLVVSKAATTTSLSVTPNVVTAGQESSAVFTATVSPVAPGGGMPTGTVTVASGATTLCTITLANATGTCNPGASALAASGVPYTITGTYNGGANYLGSSGSTTLTVITPPAPPVTSLLLTKGVASTQAGPFGASLTAAAGSTVWYRLVLTNNGTNGFAAVTLADTAAGGTLPASCPAVPAPFSAGASYTCTYSAIVAAGTTVNTATATASGLVTAATATVTATTTVPPTPTPSPTPTLSDAIAAGVNRGTLGFGTSSVVLDRPGYVTYLVRLEPGLRRPPRGHLHAHQDGSLDPHDRTRRGGGRHGPLLPPHLRLDRFLGQARRRRQSRPDRHGPPLINSLSAGKAHGSGDARPRRVQVERPESPDRSTPSLLDGPWPTVHPTGVTTRQSPRP